MLNQRWQFHFVVMFPRDLVEMPFVHLLVLLTSLVATDAFMVRHVSNATEERTNDSDWRKTDKDLSNVFNGVYTECFLRLSYSCVQEKTLLYLNELNKLREVSVIGDYVKFVKVNTTESDETSPKQDGTEKNSEKLSLLIDRAVDKFFNNHVIKFSALGKDIAVPNTVEEFVGRKRRKGGGGGHHGGGDHDGGKKKMMMMAMMCMKMKLMMMVPAMMGMMGMMSFKGMMFSMMSFMIAKMMLLMKILEKKGGGISGVDSGWPAGGGGGGAWMPAGGDYAGATGAGGYDANGQWQSRSIMDQTELEAVHNKPLISYRTIMDQTELEAVHNKPVISYVTPFVRYNNAENPQIAKDKAKSNSRNKRGIVETKDKARSKSRNKRGIVDALQYAYAYWFNRLLGNSVNRRKLRQPIYKFVNGVKYIYNPNPMKLLQKHKQPKELPLNYIKATDDVKPLIISDDFNKGEIVEGAVESRMSKMKLNELKVDVNEAIDENPWK